MKKKSHNRIVFKPYDQNQGLLLPPNPSSLIPVNHPVRVVEWLFEKEDGINDRDFIAFLFSHTFQ